MSILQPELPGARILDLFAGSGALGLEALSRGAAHCDFVEMAPRSLDAIRENATSLGALALMQLHRADALRFVESLPCGAYDIVLADPPYHQGLSAQLVERWIRAPFSRVLSVEHDQREAMPPGGVTRAYGGTAVTLYREAAAADDGGGSSAS